MRLPIMIVDDVERDGITLIVRCATGVHCSITTSRCSRWRWTSCMKTT